MTKLSKADLKERNALCDKLSVAWDALETVGNLEAGKERDDTALLAAIEAYNGEVYDANAFRENIAGEIQDYISEKSEKWQEGDKGQAFLCWQEAWEVDFPTISTELQYFDWSDIEDVRELLEQLPEAPDA